MNVAILALLFAFFELTMTGIYSAMPTYRYNDPAFRLAHFIAAVNSDSRSSNRLRKLVDELMRYYYEHGFDADIRSSIEHCKINAHIMTSSMQLRILWQAYVYSIDQT